MAIESIPQCPWKPHGPVQYRSNFDLWTNLEKAAYILDDMQQNGPDSIDTDPWVMEFLKQLLWKEIQEKLDDKE